MPSPTIRHTEYGRSGVIVGDTPEQIDAFIARCEYLRKVLGKAVHPLAIGRLVEVWPEATIEVSYHDTRYDGVNLRVTRMRVYPAAGEDPLRRPSVQRDARCHSDDQFERRVGIRIAFDRCLREVVRREDPGRVSGLGRTL